MTDETTLLPCPFCGGEAHTYKNNLWHVACENANNSCVTMSAFITEAEAIAAWNTRAGAYCAYAQPTDLTDGCAALERIAELEEECAQLRESVNAK